MNLADLEAMSDDESDEDEVVKTSHMTAPFQILQFQRFIKSVSDLDFACRRRLTF